MTKHRAISDSDRSTQGIPFRACLKPPRQRAQSQQCPHYGKTENELMHFLPYGMPYSRSETTFDQTLPIFANLAQEKKIMGDASVREDLTSKLNSSFKNRPSFSYGRFKLDSSNTEIPRHKSP